MARPSLGRTLKSLGISAQGIHQIARGDVVGDARDRGFVAWLLAGREPGAALPRVGWDVMVSAQSLLKEHAAGMSDLGIRQLSTGSIVTDPEDRRLIVRILEEATRTGARTRRRSPDKSRRA